MTLLPNVKVETNIGVKNVSSEGAMTERGEGPGKGSRRADGERESDPEVGVTTRKGICQGERGV